MDAGTAPDLGTDVPVLDVGVHDALAMDAPPMDAGTMDAGTMDVSRSEGGPPSEIALACDAGMQLCGGRCVDLRSDNDNCGVCDNDNCGECNHACATGQRCTAGACVTLDARVTDAGMAGPDG